MALSFLFNKPVLTRPGIEEDGAWSYFGGDFKTWFLSGDDHHFTSRQLFKANSPHTGAGRESTATPPYHYHLYQTETFYVKSGTLAYCIDGEEGTLQEGESIIIPPYRPHTFWNDVASGTDLVVHITVRGGDNPGFDETFDGYLSSMTMAGKKPNPFQMLLFMYTADVILVDIPFGLGRFANFFIGFLMGQCLLGYKPGYEVFDK
ncbi:hypothetical protein I305_06724 [Cryptococcus gattii E566]|uniref:Cupin type-2 domain-containing protein n=1 Tax=Cryptococcus gattii EJB2 TaxID=1296103 RepID=A0ABR5BTR0_9TREE|nr:hypothetical protein I306_03960 [Cryptococcus gattii EJB2]KIY30840.1 hypothetical protein I305_06724 [Cryptococcus gattii E566]KJE01721.1 hypothetical protein I311_04635 [Cryptococcus gattii NT-10]